MRMNLTNALLGLSLTVIIFSSSVLAQTTVVPPKNDKPLTEDVYIGQQIEAQLRQPGGVKLVTDEHVNRFVVKIGRWVVSKLPSQEFDYRFYVVDDPTVNAFAVPGGGIYINAGLIAVCQNEGQLASIIAHEIAHVSLRHGTAKRGGFWSNLGRNAISAGADWLSQRDSVWTKVLGAGATIGVGIYGLKYNRDFESQADIVGAQLMAAASYDPEDMRGMFLLLDRTMGSSPSWLSSHRNSAERADVAKIEADALLKAGAFGTRRVWQRTQDFDEVQAKVVAMYPTKQR